MLPGIGIAPQSSGILGNDFAKTAVCDTRRELSSVFSFFCQFWPLLDSSSVAHRDVPSDTSRVTEKRILHK